MINRGNLRKQIKGYAKAGWAELIRSDPDVDRTQADFPLLIRREIPRLGRGGIRSLTDPGVSPCLGFAFKRD